jgi:hypothetical protein
VTTRSTGGTPTALPPLDDDPADSPAPSTSQDLA